MTKPEVAPSKPDTPKASSPAPELSAAQHQQLAAYGGEFPEPKPGSHGEAGGLFRTALEGYHYGEATKYDFQGWRWDFKRTPINDQFQLVITCSLGGVVLVEGGVPLDRLPSKEGEEALLELMEGLTERAREVAAVAHKQSVALRSEAEEARVKAETEAQEQKARQPEGSDDRR